MYQPKFLKLSLAVLLAALTSCSKNNDIEIKGNIQGLDAEWVYLNNTYPIGKKPPLDSVEVTNGTFVFKFHPDTVFEPRLVNISYKDKLNKNRRPAGLSIINPLSKDKAKPDLFGDFLMEPGVTELTGNLSQAQGITIKAGHQTDFYWKNRDLPFSRMSSDLAKHKKQVDRLVSKVKETPDAWWALNALSNLKFQINNDELKTVLNTFDEPTRQSYSGKKIQEFLALRPGENDPRPNNLLVTPEGTHIAMIDTTKKLNMVIFWASWCGPCRAEIPTLKRVAAQIKDDRFRMVSVSLDDVDEWWKKAMAQEKMTWQQLCVDKPMMTRMLTQYNLNFIPQIFLIDGSNRKLITKFDGFEQENEPKLVKQINEYLSKS
ncbi:TlpA disulfide reductase family protein [Mucilaginibacter myungsuensis]|uniref:AhpC/TSA family protein n=1 Tax=Mucilaginibacter myungsuensis TaxID=649104 RepID=A0A929PXY3_9SPHI|nr:TlpA disulfide reductase family protein [Mucilaginibacter myungsuensis]MBE9662885.1 AhpC/TSA family protein [Mucilaginibacter myungsuensis]MDN3598305.1 TlpA disulfide reductase family protein [Mucilaginibacter myungsuensis]